MFMKNNIIQAALNEKGNYAAAFPNAHVEGMNDVKDAFAPVDLSDVGEIEKQLEGLQEEKELENLDHVRRTTKIDPSAFDEAQSDDSSEELALNTKDQSSEKIPNDDRQHGM